MTLRCGFFFKNTVMKLGFHTLTNWFGAFMVLVVFTGAIAFAFTDFMDDRLFGQKRTLFVFILLAYGVYRSARLYQAFKQTKHER